MRALAGAIALALVTSDARADITTDRCVDANTAAQMSRREGRFEASRAQLLACSAAQCPAIVRSDCAQRLDELEQAQPTIVFDVKDTTGMDIGAVKISVDGRALADRADGTAVRVDPGEHAFVFEAPGKSARRTLVVKEGEKRRIERIVVATAEPAQLPPPRRTNQKTLGLVLGGIGVAALTTGVVFGLLASASFDSQKENCRTADDCPNRAAALSDHDSAVRNGAISTIGFIAGGAFVASGMILLVTAVDPGGSSARVALRGSF